ncbi:GrpB family protein [Bacillus sp. WLY-B-L8]|uniref:GrpB family protein n=1 Tax=Bacillus multifaciens TaxID=3068506 RepID=UPI0027413C69|nr:GrpB family protein [Bacillus sp. WLY-B-L8]MDP7981097.1 GrpB family protein [Bacillus sp. WLY-B-L8]
MDKPVVIEEYTPNWTLQFTEEQKIIKEIMGDAAIAIEHIGSTSVAGLSAKPILDMMVGVRNLNDIDVFIEPLKTIEYEHVFHKEFPNRRFFRKGLWKAGTHHLHIYQYGSKEWNHNLLFRDYLRSHPNVRQQYEQLKKELANKHLFDRVAYTNAKAPFILDIIKKAKKER